MWCFSISLLADTDVTQHELHGASGMCLPQTNNTCLAFMTHAARDWQTPTNERTPRKGRMQRMNVSNVRTSCMRASREQEHPYATYYASQPVHVHGRARSDATALASGHYCSCLNPYIPSASNSTHGTRWRLQRLWKRASVWRCVCKETTTKAAQAKACMPMTT